MSFIHSWKFIHFLSAWHSLRLINLLSLFISTFYWCFSFFFFSSIPSFDFCFVLFFSEFLILIGFFHSSPELSIHSCSSASKPFFLHPFDYDLFLLKSPWFILYSDRNLRHYFASDVCLNYPVRIMTFLFQSLFLYFTITIHF